MYQLKTHIQVLVIIRHPMLQQILKSSYSSLSLFYRNLLAHEFQIDPKLFYKYFPFKLDEFLKDKIEKPILIPDAWGSAIIRKL